MRQAIEKPLGTPDDIHDFVAVPEMRGSIVCDLTHNRM
jgi:hypothetical protein